MSAAASRRGFTAHPCADRDDKCNQGFYAIYRNKDINNKQHFLTWHGILGAAATLLVTFQAVVATPMLRQSWARRVYGSLKDQKEALKTHRIASVNPLPLPPARRAPGPSAFTRCFGRLRAVMWLCRSRRVFPCLSLTRAAAAGAGARLRTWQAPVPYYWRSTPPSGARMWRVPSGTPVLSSSARCLLQSCCRL